MPIGPPSQDEPIEQDSLAPGMRLNEFEIVRVLGAGGFGIVYLALDHVLLRYVAIKEYMPTALAGRRVGATVSLRSARLAQTFSLGLESFFNEARLLASFDNPSLVKVHRFWKANGTAYMAMQYYPGLTLKEARLKMQAAPDEAWLRGLVEPLLSALEVLHRAGVYHRDISPDNILLLPDGRPVLLDFGSARRVVGNYTQSLTALLKPNFAPVEQYADEAGMPQGPWTDLYALGATVHFALTAQPPPPAVMRAVLDTLPLLSSADRARFAGVPRSFLATIDWTLAVAPGERPQCVASVRQALKGAISPPAPSPRQAAALDPASPGSTIEGPAGDASMEAVILSAGSANSANAIAALASHGRGPRMLVAWVFGGLGALGCGIWALSTSSALPSPVPGSTIAPSAASTRALPPTAAAQTALPVAQGARVPLSSSDIEVSTSAPAGASAATAGASGPQVPPTPRRYARASRVIGVRRSLPGEAAGAHARRATASREAPVEPAKSTPQSPKELCSGRNFISRAICMSRECGTANSRALPECAAVRRADEQRQRRGDQQ
jgi:serine/threonine protein kinase